MECQCIICADTFRYIRKGSKNRKYCDNCAKVIQKKQTKAATSRWRHFNKEKVKNFPSYRANVRRQSKRVVDELRDAYIRGIITDSTGLKGKNIPQGLINKKREQVYARRLYFRAKRRLRYERDKKNEQSF